MAPINAGLRILVLSVLAGCHSSSEEALNTSPLDTSATTALMVLLGGTTALTDDAESSEALRIAESYPVPTPPEANTPFEIQPHTRFEQWTLSSMTQEATSKAWRWSSQEFFRIGLVEKNAAPSASNWGFSDVLGQRYAHFNFANNEQVTDISAERLAMSLATVTKDSIAFNDIRLDINNEGCRSVLTVQRGKTQSEWQSLSCPERLRLNDAIFGTSTRALPNGVAWISHTYGQLPSGVGAVIIERLEVIMPNGDTLNVSRSRRRSGSGPTTVLATLGNTELSDVEWINDVEEGSVFPQKIRLHVPALSQTLTVQVPDAIKRASNGATSNAQHGVVVSSDADKERTLPGRVFLYPLMDEET